MSRARGNEECFAPENWATLVSPCSRDRPRDRSAGISEKCRRIHLYSARRISWDYLRIAGLDECDFHSSKIYLDSLPSTYSCKRSEMEGIFTFSRFDCRRNLNPFRSLKGQRSTLRRRSKRLLFVVNNGTADRSEKYINRAIPRDPRLTRLLQSEKKLSNDVEIQLTFDYYFPTNLDKIRERSYRAWIFILSGLNTILPVSCRKNQISTVACRRTELLALARGRGIRRTARKKTIGRRCPAPGGGKCTSEDG